MSEAGLSAVVEAAARGRLPEWAEVSDGRREHMARVAALMRSWAESLRLPERDVARWVAVGWLHDALRERPARELRPLVPAYLGELPPPLLHGPAVAERLRDQVDGAALDAMRYHTIGHPSLDRLGRALYLADFLEPGRDFEEEWRESLRRRMPHDLDGVLREVVAARIRHLLEVGKPIRPETAAFWSTIVTAA